MVVCSQSGFLAKTAQNPLMSRRQGLNGFRGEIDVPSEEARRSHGEVCWAYAASRSTTRNCADSTQRSS